MKIAKYAIYAILFIALVYYRKDIIDVFTPEKWDLMICEEMLDASQCYSNKYILEDYGSQAECMQKGIELTNKAEAPGFECGRDCYSDDTFGLVCEVICNRSGCG